MIVCPHTYSLTPWEHYRSFYFFFFTIPTHVFICFLMQPEFHGSLLSLFPFQHHSLIIFILLVLYTLGKTQPSFKNLFLYFLREAAKNCHSKSNEWGWQVYWKLVNINSKWNLILPIKYTYPHSPLSCICHPHPLLLTCCFVLHVFTSQKTQFEASLSFHYQICGPDFVFFFSSSFISQYPLFCERSFLSFKLFLALKCGPITNNFSRFLPIYIILRHQGGSNGFSWSLKNDIFLVIFLYSVGLWEKGRYSFIDMVYWLELSTTLVLVFHWTCLSPSTVNSCNSCFPVNRTLGGIYFSRLTSFYLMGVHKMRLTLGFLDVFSAEWDTGV